MSDPHDVQNDDDERDKNDGVNDGRVIQIQEVIYTGDDDGVRQFSLRILIQLNRVPALDDNDDDESCCVCFIKWYNMVIMQALINALL